MKPCYGVGNASAFDEARVTGADPYLYRLGRTLRSVVVPGTSGRWYGAGVRALPTVRRRQTVLSFRVAAGSKVCPGIHWVTYPTTADAATE